MDAGTHSRSAGLALALGAAGTTWLIAPLGIYSEPLALGAAGLALLAPRFFARGEQPPVDRLAIAAVLACTLAVVVGLLGFIGSERVADGFKTNLEGLTADTLFE